MISVPPWVLAAAVMLSGCAISFWSMQAEEESDNNENARMEGDANMGYGVFGMLMTTAGLGLLWIGPNPEPLSAWITIVVSAAGSGIAMKRANERKWRATKTILATSVLMAATFIIRASIPGFN